MVIGNWDVGSHLDQSVGLHTGQPGPRWPDPCPQGEEEEAAGPAPGLAEEGAPDSGVGGTSPGLGLVVFVMVLYWCTGLTPAW